MANLRQVVTQAAAHHSLGKGCVSALQDLMRHHHSHKQLCSTVAYACHALPATVSVLRKPASILSHQRIVILAMPV